jgi:dCMP deaminase
VSETNRITRHQMLMDMATAAAKRGTCLRLQVGAVIAAQGRPLSVGYNGAPPRVSHCTPDNCGPDKPCTRAIHAEANAIAWAARQGHATLDCGIYTTVSPCLDCAKLIISAGINLIVFKEPYRDRTPLIYLENASCIVYQIDVNGNICRSWEE